MANTEKNTTKDIDLLEAGKKVLRLLSVFGLEKVKAYTDLKERIAAYDETPFQRTLMRNCISETLQKHDRDVKKAVQLD